MGISTGFKRPDGLDIGIPLVEKSYLIDRYPDLVNTFNQAGLWTWGSNSYRQLGDNTTINKSSPVQTVSGGTNWKFVSCSQSYTAAVKTDGTLWTWGSNSYGQLGDNTTINKSSPVQTVSQGTNWQSVAAGYYHTAAIKTDGTLWTWGSNQYGQLGTNSTVSQSSPVQTVSQGTNWKLVAIGYRYTAAIKTDGTLWTWGSNNIGQLGTNSTVSQSSPVQTVSQGTNWRSVAGGYYHTAAIKTDGTLWLWGYNNNGALGDNTTINKSSPVQTVSQGTNWKLVASGRYYTAAIKTDGTLWTWGYNTHGQLGNNATVGRSSPVQTVSQGTNWKLISAGGYDHIAAIKTDGTLWLWGRNSNGQLGTDSTVSQSSPVQTVSGGTNWRSVAAGYYHTTSIRDDSADLI